MSIEVKDFVDFHTMEIGDTLVKDFELVYSCFSEAYRLYVLRDEFKGFRAIALYNPYSDNTKECWEVDKSEALNVDVIFDARACFDGVRQLDFNPYVSHPCIDRLGLLLKELRKVEIETCPDADQKVQEAW